MVFGIRLPMVVLCASPGLTFDVAIETCASVVESVTPVVVLY